MTILESPALTSAQEQFIRSVADQGRNAVIAQIKKSLQTRSGKPWSVTGGRGTAWGWITVDAPPARRTAHCRLKEGATNTWPESYERVDTGEPDGSMTDADRVELAGLLGKEAVHFQGESIPSQSDAYRVALCRAMYGHAGPFTWEANWD